MTGIGEIISRNAGTFYNFRLNEPQSLLGRYISISIVSAALSVMFRGVSNDLYAALVAFQALLVGFSFNLMFYLAGSGKLQIPNTEIIEDQVEVNRLNKLGKEIFHNITYFNLVSIFAVIASLILLISSAFLPLPCISSRQTCGHVTALADTVGPIAWHVALFATFLLSIESSLTFLRLIRRASAYFEDRSVLTGTAAG